MTNPLHTSHSIKEKIFFRGTILGGYCIGAYAIFLENKWAAILYGAFVFLSLQHVVRRYCSHCPYPCEHSDCLMTSYKSVLKHVKKDQPPLSRNDRLSFPLVMLVLLPLLPQFWLIRRPVLFILFWLLFIAAWGSMLCFKCGHCRFKACLLNHTDDKGLDAMSV